jgi:prepilin-type N-terminal cleavage/methylation domain-containing protein
MRPDNTNRLRSDGFSTPSIHSQPHHQGGFTLIELLITLVIVAVLFGVSSINLGKSQQTANITATVDVLLADIKSQQSLAMFGGLGGTATAQSHGIYVQPKFYTLFPGTTYSAVNPILLFRYPTLSHYQPHYLVLKQRLQKAAAKFSATSEEVTRLLLPALAVVALSPLTALGPWALIK